MKLVAPIVALLLLTSLSASVAEPSVPNTSICGAVYLAVRNCLRGLCQSNWRSSAYDIALACRSPSGDQAMSARHSPSAAERLVCRFRGR